MKNARSNRLPHLSSCWNVWAWRLSAQILRAGRTLRWIPGELQQFDSVWVDALVRAKRLTPFQAQEINAGRGERTRKSGRICSAKNSPARRILKAIGRNIGNRARVVRLAVESRTGFQPVDLHFEALRRKNRRSRVEKPVLRFGDGWEIGGSTCLALDRRPHGFANG